MKNRIAISLSVIIIILVHINILSAQEKKTDENGYLVRESGLKYKILKKGEGEPVGLNSVIKAFYTLAFPGEEPWHSSKDDGAPLEIDTSGELKFIKAWQEAIPLMKEGSKWELYVPYKLGYGERGRPPSIPPSQDLLFTVEILELKRK